MKFSGKLNYEVNKEKGTIVAWKDGLEDEVMLNLMCSDMLKRSGLSRLVDTEIMFRLFQECLMPDKITVKVKLGHGDTWDESLGIKIVREKWRKKYHKESGKAIARLIHQLAKFITLLAKEYQDSVEKGNASESKFIDLCEN